MFRRENVRATIDSLLANVAILDNEGFIVQVNERWRRFGLQRNGASDCVGLNYIRVCEAAAACGDDASLRVAVGLRRLLDGQANSYGRAYHCAERTFRMSARRINQPEGGAIVAHQDITALLAARRDRDLSRRQLDDMQRSLAACVEDAHEELGQRLASISLAAGALESGGNVADSVTVIKLSVEEARQQLKLLRLETRPCVGER